MPVSFAFDGVEQAIDIFLPQKLRSLVVARCKVRLTSSGLFSQKGCDSLPCNYKSLEHTWTGAACYSTRRENYCLHRYLLTISVLAQFVSRHSLLVQPNEATITLTHQAISGHNIPCKRVQIFLNKSPNTVLLRTKKKLPCLHIGRLTKHLHYCSHQNLCNPPFSSLRYIRFLFSGA